MAKSSNEFLRIPCTCQGTNENCFKCGGWGYIDKIAEGRSAPPIGGLGAGSSRSALKPSRGTVAKNRKIRPAVNCPQCGVLTTRLSRHSRKVHGESGPAQDRPTPLASSGNFRLVRCPICTCTVREDHLERHSRRVHHLRGNEARRQIASPVEPSPTNQTLRPAQASELAAERVLDATRDYYAAYRDHGQFGSHPSHDGYDDESNP